MTFNPFRGENEVERRVSVVAAGALLAWIVWLGIKSSGFSEFPLRGWVVFIGVPVAACVVLRAALPFLRNASRRVRYAISTGALWCFAVGTWGYIWNWEKTFSIEQYAALFALPPVGLALGLLLWRWSRAGSSA